MLGIHPFDLHPGSHALMRFVVKAGAYTTGLAVVVIGAIWYYQENLVFHPEVPQGKKFPESNPKPFQNPLQLRMPYETVTFQAADGVKLQGWLMKQPNEYQKAMTILFFQGNAGNSGLRLQHFYMLYRGLNANIFSVSYRGYGHSEGKPSEQGFYLDAEAALDYLLSRDDINTNRLIAFGQSIGGAVAIDLAAKRDKIYAVIVENTFTSLRDMSLHVFPVFKLCPCILRIALRLQFDTIRKVKIVKHPLMFIYGTADDLVPPSHSAKLHDAAISSKVKSLFAIENGSHNDLWFVQQEAYCRAISDFLKRVSDGEKDTAQCAVPDTNALLKKNV